MGLNYQQLEAKKIIENFIKNETGIFALLGAGGTGKTYLITSLEDSEKYQFLAPTNKVVNVLRKSLIKNGCLSPKVKTVDSFFNLKMQKDENNKTIYSYKQPKIEILPDVIVVDECSMLSKKHIELLTNLSKPIPIIFLGDDMQIPPVEGNYQDNFIDVDGFVKSYAFKIIKDSYKLTLQNRQAESSDLFKLINGFRNHMQVKMCTRKIASKKSNNKDIFYTKQNSIFLHNFIKNNKDVVMIGFRNNTCDLFNYKIGSIKSNTKNYNIRKANEGDYLMFNKYYRKEEPIEADNENLYYTKKTIFYTSEIIKVKKLFSEVVEIEIPYSDKVFKEIQPMAIVENEMGLDKVIWLKNSELRKKIYSHVYNLKNKINDRKHLAKLNTFYADFLIGFADLKKPYAITSHKSQGSTYKNVIIPVYDFYKKRHQDANQLLYVAMSRASEKIIFVDGFCNFSGSTKRINFTEEERCLIAGSQDWKCNNCDNELTDGRYDIDHIKRLGTKDSKGKIVGTNDVSNLQAICKKCHKEKTKIDKQ